MRKAVRIAVAGAGGHGAVLLDAVSRVQGLTLRACHDIDTDTAARAAKVYGCEASPSYDGMLERPDIDAVVIVTPNHAHRDQAVAALRAGKDVFIEKPLALNVEEGRSIAAAAKSRNRIVQVGYNMRKRADIVRARELVASGRIGLLVACHGTFAHDQAATAAVPAWKLDPALCPLLPMTQLGTHIIDAIEYIAGPVTAVTCAARANAGLGAGTVDTTAALLQIGSSVLATVQSHYVVPDRFDLQLLGTRGWIVIEAATLTMAERSGSALEVITETHEQSPYASFVGELEEFTRCVRERTAPAVDARAAMHSLAVIEAMDISARENRTVRITEEDPGPGTR